MTPSARLAAAIEALGAISAEAAPPADRVLDRYFRDRRYIGSKDRQAIAERVFGVLRRRARSTGICASRVIATWSMRAAACWPT